MTEEEKKPEEEKKAEEEEEKKPEEEKKAEDDKKDEEEDKAKSVIDYLKSVSEALQKIDDRISKQDAKIKAMETPTDLPLKPKLSDVEDIGDDTKVPDTYQSNSVQAGIDDSDPKNQIETDEKKLEMQEKGRVEIQKASPENSYTTDAPRPGMTGAQEILKSEGLEPNPVLAAARQVGYEGLHLIAKDIRNGKYIKNPTIAEKVRTW